MDDATGRRRRPAAPRRALALRCARAGTAVAGHAAAAPPPAGPDALPPRHDPSRFRGGAAGSAGRAGCLHPPACLRTRRPQRHRAGACAARRRRRARASRHPPRPGAGRPPADRARAGGDGRRGAGGGARHTEARLHDRADATAEAGLAGHTPRIHHEQAAALRDQAGLHHARRCGGGILRRRWRIEAHGRTRLRDRTWIAPLDQPGITDGDGGGAGARRSAVARNADGTRWSSPPCGKRTRDGPGQAAPPPRRSGGSGPCCRKAVPSDPRPVKTARRTSAGSMSKAGSKGGERPDTSSRRPKVKRLLRRGGRKVLERRRRGRRDRMITMMSRGRQATRATASLASSIPGEVGSGTWAFSAEGRLAAMW